MTTIATTSHDTHEMTADGGYDFAPVVGREVLWTSAWDDRQQVGIAEIPPKGPAFDSAYLIARFPDGSWARLDAVVEVLA